eukprot:10923039-Alexandrium_andersonii.AAC.1
MTRCRLAQLHAAGAARAAATAADSAPGAVRFDDPPEVLPDGAITNAEMRRDFAALRDALARHGL